MVACKTVYGESPGHSGPEGPGLVTGGRDLRGYSVRAGSTSVTEAAVRLRGWLPSTIDAPFGQLQAIGSGAENRSVLAKIRTSIRLPGRLATPLGPVVGLLHE